MIPAFFRAKLSRFKRRFTELRLTEFNQPKFDAAVTWVRRSKLGVVFLNIVSLEILAAVKVLKTIKFYVKGNSAAPEFKTQQEQLSLLPKQQSSPRILLIAEASIPQCLHYRVKQKIEQFEANGFYAQWHDWSDIGMLEQAIYHFDMVWFYRVPGYPAILDLMQQAKKLRKLVVYDIDDLIFDREKIQQAFGQTTEQLNDKDLQGILSGASLYKQAIETAHYGIASTPVLQQQLAELVTMKKCFVLPNGLDSFIESCAESSKIPAQDDMVRIFYGSGTKTHDEDFALVAEPLAKLLEGSAKVCLVLAGQLSIPESLQSFADRIQRLPSMDFASYLHCLQHSDIAIAPLKSGVFADCKSEIKWLEAACLAVPSVLSHTARYAETVEHEDTAYLAKTSDDWWRYLSELVQSKSLREKVGKAAQQCVKKDYGSEAMATIMAGLCADIQQQAMADHLLQDSVSKPKKRILIVNVLYPPQAIGGATTVAVQSVQGLLQAHAGEFDIEVLTTEMSDEAPYTLHQYEHEGVKVTAIRVPSHIELESRDFDEQVYQMCLRWLPQNRPDLIHFHSMQRLTAAPLQAAVELEVPYVVTVHDAWWISAHQFLLDDQEQLVDLQQSNPLIAASTSDAAKTVARTRYLAEQLQGAKQLFAVSEFQAKLYKSNGFEHVTVLKNGVSYAPEPETMLGKKSETPGKLVIGYLGGISAHKGYHFLKDIISSSSFDNLQFEVIDLFKPADFKQTSRWGQSTVLTWGKQVGADIEDFYADIDVLIAPSIWPESFGLVTREAALRNKWVIAADAGGLAEDIIEGETGLVFSMNDQKACAAILEDLNKNWQQYKNTQPKITLSQDKIFSQEKHIQQLAEHYLS